MILECNCYTTNCCGSHILLCILVISLASCSKPNYIDISGKWNAFTTVDFCGNDYVQKSKINFVSEGNRIIKIQHSKLKSIDFSRNDPESCEEQTLKDTFVIIPKNLPKVVNRHDLLSFFPEWDGLNAAHSYSVKKFSNNEFIVRAVISGNLGDVQTRTYKR